MMSKKRAQVGLIVLCLVMSLIPPAYSASNPEEQTRHIQSAPFSAYDDDQFVTETGIGHSSTLVTVLDPNMDIRTYLLFKDMKINTWFYLINATLRLHTASSLEFDADSKFTIYGIDDYQRFGLGTAGSPGYGAPALIMSAPLTAAHVDYNSSQFYGSQWWDIDVTNIVRELYSNRNWDGPGKDPNDPGDNMGFIFLGAEGSDTRYFYDLQAGNGKEAQLHLHWDFSPAPPGGYPDAVFNKTYRNNTIWELPGALGYPPEPIEYVYTNGSADPWTIQYDDDGGSGPYDVSDSESSVVTSINSQRKLIRLDNGTLYIIYWKELAGKDQIYVKMSDDEGVTWINDERISVNVPKNMDAYDQDQPAIAVDSHDRLHAVWFGRDDDFAQEQVWYSRYTDSWSTPVRISVHASFFGGFYVSIAVDSNDSIRVVYDGRTNTHPADFQIWYTAYTASWSNPARISLVAGMENEDNSAPTIAIDSEDNLHVTYRGDVGAGLWLYYTKRDSGWSASITLSVTATSSASSIAINSEDSIFVLFTDDVPGNPEGQVLLREYDGSWLPQVKLSNFTGMEALSQSSPSVAIDSNDYINVVWAGKATGFGVDSIWYALNNGSWNMPPVLLQPLAKNAFPSLRWARWPIPGVSTWIVTNANGTVLTEELDDFEDAVIFIDDLLGGPTPDDPAPPSQGWPESGVWTRFRTRFYFLLIGFGLIFGPLMVFAYSRPSGYEATIGMFIMLIGFALMIAAGNV